MAVSSILASGGHGQDVSPQWVGRGDVEKGSLHHFDAARSRDGRRATVSSTLSGGPTVDPLVRAFEADLAAWLTWLGTVHAGLAEARLMRKLELVYTAGWTAATVAALAIMLVGVVALTMTGMLLATTLLLGYVVTAPAPNPLKVKRDAAVGPFGWPVLGQVERACLTRIINLTRVAASPRGEALLSSEVDEALATGPLAGWPPLLELRDMLRCGFIQLTPFGSDTEPTVLDTLC
jgi:hypothetical protein